MAQTLTSLAALDALPFDDIIDVRSPAEYAEDHIPGAINLPVLSDAERARVGTIYVQQDRFLARKVGAALVARNAARHLEGALADRQGGWRPLVYCWRGGQRSGSFAAILGQIGWRVDVISGGYKAYRKLVVDALYSRPPEAVPLLIDGGTGTAKTALLQHLAAAGEQVIDLEGLAAHRGSLLGGVAGGQPAQKAFESRLATALARVDPDRPLWLEAESNKIGDLLIPPSLWAAMRRAPRIRVEAPLAARARFLTTAYADLLADPEALSDRLSGLTPFHGRERVAQWQQMAHEGEFAALAAELVSHHYDPRYAKAAARAGAPAAVLSLDDLSAPSLRAAVPRLMALADRVA
jgi:tRNA 2-selenouridine synthase